MALIWLLLPKQFLVKMVESIFHGWIYALENTIIDKHWLKYVITDYERLEMKKNPKPKHHIEEIPDWINFSKETIVCSEIPFSKNLHYIDMQINWLVSTWGLILEGLKEIKNNKFLLWLFHDNSHKIWTKLWIINVNKRKNTVYLFSFFRSIFYSQLL